VSEPDPQLEVLAEEELAAARKMSWRDLSRITPWSDNYRGYTPSGREVEIERSYIWAQGEPGDVLCEVIVRGLGSEAQANCVVRKPG
jgi:hypothetical protein